MRLGRKHATTANELSGVTKAAVVLLALDRDAAAALKGTQIGVHREQLPGPGEGEYYWHDLVGLRVQTTQGMELGTVDHLIETGANDVLVVRGERERLIPFIRGQVVLSIDLAAGEMRVDWDPEF